VDGRRHRADLGGAPRSVGVLATVADVTNDYSLYPFADLAPETEHEFGRTWRAMACAQLSEWTLPMGRVQPAGANVRDQRTNRRTAGPCSCSAVMKRRPIRRKF
jgi:hypothetical protein